MNNTKCRKHFPLTLILILFCFFPMRVLSAPHQFFEEETEMMDRLLKMGLAELLDIKIFSADKKSRKISETAAAVFVITREDIRRSSAKTIPELLRMVPGVQVARINASAYAIGVRGFNSSFSNKLLVLIDGRSVYTPDFSGVYWEMIDYPMADIERIEVIHGSGGTLWGSNAVNGVINIITRHAKDTQESLLVVGGGYGDSKYTSSVRVGGKWDNQDVFFRAYLKKGGFHDFPKQSKELTNFSVADQWNFVRFGFRLDGEFSESDTIRISGDRFQTRSGKDEEFCVVDFCFPVAQINDEGFNLSVLWEHKFSDISNMQFKFYLDYNRREDLSLIAFDNRVIDIEFQHHLQLSNHDILWGGGVRELHADTYFSLFHEFRPSTLDGHSFNFFLQDDISLNENLRLTLGTKFEKNYYTGWGVQPNLRLLWKSSSDTTWWGAVSRAVRIPSRFEFSSYFDSPEFNLIRSGNDQLDVEELLSYELGWRQRFGENVSLDVSAFYNIYDDLVVVDNFITAAGVDTGIFENGMRAESFGLEVNANWFVSDSWRVQASYSWLHIEAHLDEGIETLDYAYDPATETRDPEHQVSLRSSMDLARNVELDVWLRYTGKLDQYSDTATGSGISEHLDLDLRAAWQVTKEIEISVSGRNLLEKKHDEFGQEPLLLYFRNSIPRSLYVQFKGYF